METVHDFDEFNRLRDKTFTPHFEGYSKIVDKLGLIYEVVFQVTAPSERLQMVSGENTHIVRFMVRQRIDTNTTEFYKRYEAVKGDHYARVNAAINEVVNEFIAKFAKPISATTGSWK